MFPALNMHHSIQTQSHHETCYELHPDQYADDSFSLSDDDNTPEDTPPTPRATPASALEYLEDEEEEEDFQTVPQMMIIGPLRKYLIEHCVYMNTPYHMDYAHIHALMQTTKLLHM